MKVSVEEDNVYYLINSDAYVEAELWKVLQKPIIFKSSKVLLKGIVLINNQCLVINKQDENKIIGIDCYSRFLQNQEFILCDKNNFCYSIKEDPILSFLEDDFEMQNNYKKILYLHRFCNIQNNVSSLSFFDNIKYDAFYVVKARKLFDEYDISNTITGISFFDSYLFFITKVFEKLADKFEIFNTLLKGCEAIIHYQSLYILINERIEINQVYTLTTKEGLTSKRVDEFVESGSLGSWVNLAQEVLISKSKYETSWYSQKINTNDSIWKAILNQRFPIISKFTSYTTNYGLISQRIINIRNNTIGHGSSGYTPDNDQLIYLFEIYLYLLKATSINFYKIMFSEKQVWLLEADGEVKFLDIFIRKENTLKYIDYINESFTFEVF